jgi:beta-glucanase (GH16 family)
MLSKAQVVLLWGLPLIHAAVPAIPGFSITWSDDFIGGANSLPNTANWIVDTGTSYPGGPANWGTGEIETYTSSPNNLKLDGVGNLMIIPQRDASGAWTSARIETQRTDFIAAVGGRMRMQASIQMPGVTGAAASGYWPAFWSLGSAFRGNFQNWPMIGEFDIMENVNGLNEVFGTLHCGTDPGGPCDETTGLGATLACPGTACQGNFHTYTFEVDRTVNPEVMRWSVDGTEYHTITEDQVGAATWTAAVDDTHFILLNVAMGGSFPNALAGAGTPTSSTQSGVPMIVDYVAVYNT